MKYTKSQLKDAIKYVLGDTTFEALNYAKTPLPTQLDMAIKTAFLNAIESPSLNILRAAGNDLRNLGWFDFDEEN